MHQKRIGGRIANELLMMLRMRKKTSKEVSLYEPIGTDREGNEINLLDIIEGESVDIPEIMDLEADTRRLYQILGGALTQREKEVLRMRYGLFGTKEKTQREIAEQMGISRSYVSRIEKTALNKLKAVF